MWNELCLWVGMGMIGSLCLLAMVPVRTRHRE